MGEFLSVSVPAVHQLDHHLKQIFVRRGKRGQTFITRFVPLYLPTSACLAEEENGFGAKIILVFPQNVALSLALTGTH